MKAVPAKLVALGLFCMALVGVLLLEARLGRAAAESLSVTAVARQVPGGQVELDVAWQWGPTPPVRGWRSREHLLAVSFDMSQLVMEWEEAPLGKGANGEILRKLEQVAGADGARRLFVIPEGADGSVRLRFHPRHEDAHMPDPFRVFVAFEPPSSPVWVKETTVAQQDF